MTAALTTLVAAAAATLLLRLSLGSELIFAAGAGVVLAVLMLLAFHRYQKLRIAENERLAHVVAGLPR